MPWKAVFYSWCRCSCCAEQLKIIKKVGKDVGKVGESVVVQMGIFCTGLCRIGGNLYWTKACQRNYFWPHKGQYGCA